MAFNFKDFLFAFILFSLFGTLTLMVVVNQASNSNKDTSDVIGGSLDYYKFNSSVAGVESTAENLRTQFEKQSFWSSIAGIIVTGMFGIAKSMFLMIFTPFTLLGGILTSLGIPSIVTNTLLGLMILGVIFAIWELIKV